MADPERQPKPVAHCLFCDETKLTDEHIWPDWIVREFKKRLPPKRGLYTAKHVRSDGKQFSFTAGSIERKERLVCGPCNWNWMSQLETCASPLLKPLIFGPNRHTAFDCEALCTMAAWFTLRSMVFDGMLERTERYYSPGDCARFATDELLSPPPKMFIWVGLYRGNEQYAARYYVHNRIISKAERLHIFTGLIHNLAFKVVTWKGLKLTFRASSHAAWGNITRRAWPYRKHDVPWPPPLSVTDKGFEAFRHWLVK